MPILIFANGDIENPAWVSDYLSSATAVIAVDGGARHILGQNHFPDVLIGDLDSLSPATVAELEKHGTKIIRYPTAKDETDLELALLYAVEQSAWQKEPLYIFGVLGGRLDQTLANILLLAHAALASREVRIVEQRQQAWLVTGHTVITGHIGDRVSLVPLGGPVKIEQTSGLKWPLENETLNFGPARGVSNMMTSTAATVDVHSGRLLCIQSHHSWTR